MTPPPPPLNSKISSVRSVPRQPESALAAPAPAPVLHLIITVKRHTISSLSDAILEGDWEGGTGFVKLSPVEPSPPVANALLVIVSLARQL